ncbi:MAG: glycosyltransferase family 39 protein [Planctomycetota bacterium]
MQEKTFFSNKILLCILILLLCSFFLDIGQRDLWSAGEARAALIAERMNKEKNYLIPTMPEGPSYAKPPLFYWLVTLGPTEDDGRFGALAVRLPSVLSAIILVCCVCYVGELWLGPQIGYLAAIILCTNLKFFWMARVGRIDMLLTLFIFLTLIAVYWTWKSGNRFGLFFASFICALGTLAKGPIALFLPGLVILVTLIYQDPYLFRKNNFLRQYSGCLLGAFLFYLLLTVPWYLLIHYRTSGVFTQQFLFRHNLARYMGSIQMLENVLDLDSSETLRDFDTSQPFWYMVPRLFGDFFPWSIFLPSCIYFFFKSRSRQPGTVSFFAFCVVASITIFLFFSISSFKRGDYLLPVFPPLALLLACYWKRLPQISPEVRWIQKIFMGSWSLFCLIFATATLIPDQFFTLSFWDRILKDADFQNLQKIHLFFKASRYACFIFLGFILLSLFSFFWVAKRSPPYFCLYLGLITSGSLSLVLVLFFPYFDEIRSLKPFVTRIHQRMPLSQPLIIIGRAYDFNDLHYHLQRQIEHIETAPDSNRGYQILRETPDGDFEAQWILKKPPENWEDQQWEFFFQFLKQPKQHFFLIREKDLKKIPINVPYYCYTDNKESARKILLLISNSPPPPK